MSRRWPTLSVWIPEFEQADQVWYLILVLITVSALFMEWWWVAVPMMIWLHLSLAAFRRERKEVEARRAQIVARAVTMKKKCATALPPIRPRPRNWPSSSANWMSAANILTITSTPCCACINTKPDPCGCLRYASGGVGQMVYCAVLKAQ